MFAQPRADDAAAPSSTSSPARLPHASRAQRPFDVVAITASMGGLDALSQVLGALPPDFSLPILVVQHLSARFPSQLVDILDRRTVLPVTWAQPGRLLRPGVVYIAPPDWHLLVGSARSVHLSQRPPVQFVRPSADVLFESVAASYGERALAVVLTGSRSDGARGAEAIKRAGGWVLAQDAATCVVFDMPRAAIATGCVDFVLPLPTIAPALVALTMVPGAAALLGRQRRAALR